LTATSPRSPIRPDDTVTYARDSLGRSSGVTTKKDASSATVTLASSVAHQPFGPLAGLTYGNGLTLTRTFTQDYLIDTLSVVDGATPIIQRGFARGDDINLTSITEGAVSGRDETYVYTAANRLQEGDGPWGTLTWSHDLVGNRTAEVLTQGGTTTWTYAYPSGSNRLSTVTQGSTVRTFTHDGGGNVTAADRAGTNLQLSPQQPRRLAAWVLRRARPNLRRHSRKSNIGRHVRPSLGP
jgi:hypothetical protein